MPASYPTSAKTFTTKNAGDTIQPAHINDLQDEVAAIENGLLNGDAPLQSSNSTFANLSVPGLSTFTGDVTMSGTLTVNKIVSTSITVSGVTSFVTAYVSTAVQFSTAQTVVVFGNRTADLSSEYDSTSGTFTPKSSGYYQINVNVQTLGADLCYAALFVNSSQVALAYNSQGAGNVWASQHISFVAHLSSGAAGAVQVKAWINGSTGRTDTSGTYLNILKVF